MTHVVVRKAGKSDASAISDTLGQAFVEDPALRWLFPKAARRRRLASSFFAWTLDTISLPLDEVWCTQDRTAAALWAPPNRWRVNIAEQLRLVPRLVMLVRARAPRILLGFNKLESRHPEEPHWYLYFIGTRPDRQGNGSASALLATMFQRSDKEGVPVFLEATSDELVPFYVRHGFTVLDRVTPRGGPAFTQMWREPR